MSNLGGMGVLITRPRHQSGNLASLVEKAGGVPLLLPTIEIRPLGKDEDQIEQFKDAGTVDLVIFVSSNAVNYGQTLLAELAKQPITLACIGPATARAMKHLGSPPDLVPDSGFNSEALLAEPALSEVAGRSVIIVRGENGRELLGQSLRQRDALVTYIETYRRTRSQPAMGEVDQIESRWANGGIGAVTAYSAEALENLMALLSDKGQRLLRDSQLITVSKRIAKKARQMGIAEPALIANSPSDHDVVEALLLSATN